MFYMSETGVVSPWRPEIWAMMLIQTCAGLAARVWSRLEPLRFRVLGCFWVWAFRPKAAVDGAGRRPPTIPHSILKSIVEASPS